jgi:rod shape determining protein RodA
MTGKLIVIGVLAMFMFQIFENIGMTMSVMPATGITLPFISYGGSSILSNMMAIGLVISVAVQNRGMRFEKKMKRESSNANFDFDEDSASTDAAF